MISRPMEIAFDSLEIRQICENAGQAVQDLGPEVANALRDRLADLDAAVSVTDLLAGSPRVIQQKTNEVMVVDLCDGWSLMFSANHNVRPTDENGRIAWDIVTRIKILQIQQAGGHYGST